MQLCSCGFANTDDARTCTACGAPLAISPTSTEAQGGDGTAAGETADSPLQASDKHCQQAPAPLAASALLLEDVRTGEVIRCTAPGGVLGRAGDFSPDAFSPRVSGVHAVVALNEEGRWTLEHTGRNGTSVERGGAVTPLRAGAPWPLFGGETLKMADMLFRVSLEDAPEDVSAAVRTASGNAPSESAGSIPPSADTATGNDSPAETSSTDGAIAAWSVRCPVCGTEHGVAGPEERVASCSFCRDALDARQIARIAPRLVTGA
ncbi:FHA domain-containing protein [uncultured Adlercreutzia sp.]|uniref:FHA domain-containing protein n=1 Tax=uncultured Adlercreutzia sp. TaxID=875803 RepID=UPI0025FAB1A9|nr:FHA domain-containing protein [uncultured Adlercreutzia sp.]